MRTHDTIAVFPTADIANAALVRLRQLSLPEARLMLSASRTLTVSSSRELIDTIWLALQQAGASDVVVTENTRQPGWFSHQAGPVTGSGATPGQGDSEAGE